MRIVSSALVAVFALCAVAAATASATPELVNSKNVELAKKNSLRPAAT